MSDYLWDKKGEPDAEVARLEALLGAFAHEPRRLELPAESAAPEPQRARLLPFAAPLRTSRRFAPVALAAAAALLVASALVASLLLRARVAESDGRTAAHESSRPTRDARREERPAPREAGRVAPEAPAAGAPAAVAMGQVEKAAVESLPRVVGRRREVRPSAAPGQRPKLPAAGTLAAEPDAGLTLEGMSTPAGASSLVESARLLTKEQLLYALRLTGAKLKDMREKAQETMSNER